MTCQNCNANLEDDDDSDLCPECLAIEAAEDAEIRFESGKALGYF